MSVTASLSGSAGRRLIRRCALGCVALVCLCVGVSGTVSAPQRSSLCKAVKAASLLLDNFFLEGFAREHHPVSCLSLHRLVGRRKALAITLPGLSAAEPPSHNLGAPYAVDDTA